MRVHEHNLGFYLENFSAYSDSIAKCVDIYILVCSVLDIYVEANISKYIKIHKNNRFFNLTKRVQHTCSGISLQLF